MKIFEHRRMWHIRCMFHVSGLINTRVIKANALYGNLVFRALQSCYLWLFPYIHAYEFRNGSKIPSWPEDRIKTPMSSAILSVNCLLIPLGVKRNTHTFYTTVPNRCMLLVMLKGSDMSQQRCTLKGIKNSHKWFVKSLNYLWKACSFELRFLIPWKRYFQQTKQITVHIHMNQQWRLLSPGLMCFIHAAFSQDGRKLGELSTLFSMPRPFAKPKCQLYIWGNGERPIQINNIWVWALCKTDTVKNLRNKLLLLLRGLQPGSRTLQGSGRWILWIHRKKGVAYTYL